MTGYSLEINAKQKTKVPKLRFSEFIGTWEDKKFSDIAHVIMGQSPIGDSYNTSGKGEPLINGPVEFTDKYPLKIKWTTRPTKYCEKSDILFCVRGSSTGRMNIANDKYCIGRGVAAIRTNGYSIPNFLELLLIKNLQSLLGFTVGSTFQNIDSRSISQFVISIPSLPEQTKIASFLTTVDQKIQSLKKKTSLLEEYKKGIMQKLFSQELRFKDENGSDFPCWEIQTLGKITYKVDKKNKLREKHPIYSITNQVGFIPQSEHFEGMDSNERGYDISSYKIVDRETFAYNPARINVGSIGYSGSLGPVLVSSLYVCFKTTDSVHDSFFNYFIKTQHFNNSVLRNGEGGVRIYLFYENFAEIIINLPSINEQICIAKFLSLLDDKVKRIKQQISKLESWKKGLLQKMFC